MSSPLHSKQTIVEGIHTPISYEYVNASARTSATGFTPEDVNKFAKQLDDNSIWILLTTAPTWGLVSSGNVSADLDASYVVISTTGSLPNERALAAGSGLLLNDGGPNSNVSLSINNNVVATLSGSIFSGNIVTSGTLSAVQGLTGSLTKLPNGTSYLVAGENVTITSQSNGQVLISAQDISGADPFASYVVIGVTGSLPFERALSNGLGLILTDNGPGSTVLYSINNNVVATISGSIFTGVTRHNAGLSGSLTRLIDGSSYLVAQGAISIVSQSNGQIFVSSSAGSLTNTIPVNVTKTSASAGLSSEAARADHKHDVSTAAPAAAGVGTVSGEGSATTLARSDHTHQSNTAPVNVTKAAANIGTSTEPARADHKHDVTTAVAVALGIGSSNNEGVATTLARSDHTHTITGHGSTTAVVSGAGTVGVVTNFARGDHTHGHGTHADGTHHAAATVSVAGFMSASDKAKLNNIATPGPAATILQVSRVQVSTNISTTSTTFVDLTELTTSLTTSTGSSVVIGFRASGSNQTNNQGIRFRILVDGVSAGGCGLTASGTNNPTGTAFEYVVTGLSAALHTFKIQWRATAGTAQIRAATLGDEESASFTITEVI